MKEFKQTRFQSLDKATSRIHRWRGHRQERFACGPCIDGWQAYAIFCNCGTRFSIVV
ncbi:hypothetical protein SEA_ODESZA_85 [Gordonia Phage Odesza]|uniref:Uncharacterized protein n=5 Tax=Tanisvirus tanis TaxID=2844677 RepID=A0A7D5FTP7_9CAUD|nr:hypothetical protein HWC73_gp86 [Gordonia phage Tanis]AVO25324.1 hypothetical protein PBI_GRAVY_85 [Gordonia phage Gravy]AVO25417.1 hypothetical protein PBI_KERRY_85 [Gordonia phage Kerry]QGJ89704.1 hypothetical protein SEA_ODESZA_85 [Gordonia Phage Odesza]QKY78765.1 hypothetical protein SEA_GILL_86 [Gordonia phage Gill]QLF83801.1 hypothetical protein SEA_MAGEL_87 [Gordonia phage Magel]